MQDNRYDMVGEVHGIPRNADCAFSYVWAYNGVRVPLDGHTLDWKFYRERRGGASPLFTLSNGDEGGITVAEDEDGRAYYRIPQSALAALHEGFYYYYARDISPGGIILLVHGRAELWGPPA
jgi:hypothetical protein